MKSNAPANYACPICLGNQGIESEDTLLKQADLVFSDELTSVGQIPFGLEVMRVM